jgi:hypothetical protein
MSASTRLLCDNPYACANNDLADDFGTIAACTPAQVRDAQRTVAGRAADADEARELLAMLGIGGRV